LGYFLGEIFTNSSGHPAKACHRYQTGPGSILTNLSGVHLLFYSVVTIFQIVLEAFLFRCLRREEKALRIFLCKLGIERSSKSRSRHRIRNDEKISIYFFAPSPPFALRKKCETLT
jgi:hypothetical protein